MIEALIIPGSVLGFLFTWVIAEEAAFRRAMQRIADAARKLPVEPAPAPATPAVTKRRRWF